MSIKVDLLSKVFDGYHILNYLNKTFWYKCYCGKVKNI